ncbi:macro domain-containing protein VPA0103-like [Impatiens glandulifera]|uniref:macro domain-containing protein VPA0103-like n=1 Tax=Impatiens glandulifera TaxID=253017 RepID=UPI001FB181AB|nr:macro domain-containing protein VPA0103-like [Impatiens glandulifera]
MSSSLSQASNMGMTSISSRLFLSRLRIRSRFSTLFNQKPKNIHGSAARSSRSIRDRSRPLFKMEGINGGSSASRVSTVSKGRISDDGSLSVQFQLSSSSAFVIQKGDITKWFVDGSTDAIVNPANERMLGGGGADGAIHDAAGPELRAACYEYPEVRRGVRCPTGEARITRGFRLPVSHVIHTVGPIYDMASNPQASLRNSYKNSLQTAKENNIQYIAFPAISCGVYRYPYDEAATIAINTVKEFANDFKEVHFVLFSDDIYNAWLSKAKNLFQDQ